MSRYVPPNLPAMLTRACGWQKQLLGAHWSVKHFWGLAFRADVAERRRVDVDGNKKCQLAGTWAERTREWAGRNVEMSDGEPGMVDVLFWSRNGHWGLGVKRRKLLKFRAGKKVWFWGRGTEKPALFSVLIPQALSSLVENCQLTLLK